MQARILQLECDRLRMLRLQPVISKYEELYAQTQNFKMQMDQLRMQNEMYRDQLMRQSNEKIPKCGICREMYTNPHALNPCGHVFCHDCLQSATPIQNCPIQNCPVCRMQVEAVLRIYM